MQAITILIGLCATALLGYYTYILFTSGDPKQKGDES